MTTSETRTLRLAAFAIDSRNPRELAEFYGRLLGWAIDESATEDDWVVLADPSGGTSLAFQHDPDQIAPTWPEKDRPQRMHVDVRVSTLDEGHERAVSAGAVQLPQPADQVDSDFRVYADPEGHPFCMCAGN
ncbi:VOC family protein [Parasphingorhabdus pacifica]